MSLRRKKQAETLEAAIKKAIEENEHAKQRAAESTAKLFEQMRDSDPPDDDESMDSQ